MKKYLLLSFLWFLSCGILAAQERTVTGTVTDGETGETLPGVNVVIVGTSSGAVTDFDGKYSVKVSDNNAVLRYSFVGYADYEEVVGARSVIDVQLGLDVTELSEVVVVGYGSQEKKEITSAVASIDEEEFNNGNVTTPGQLLQGKVAGLSIVSPGGDPNQSPAIRLRGLSTFGANSSPLIVLDGVPGASLDNIDPNDIASIDVLKDGSAAAIYGARGSSGVILITSKSGSNKGATSVSYNGFATVSEVANSIDVLSKDEFVARGGADFGSETDWFDELTQIGISQTHNLSISGSAGANTSYRASVNYRDNEGITKGVDFERINARLNISQAALDGKLRFNVIGVVNNREQQSINLAAFRYGLIYNPSAPIFDDENSIEDGGYFQRPLFDFFNPVALANQQNYVNETKNVLANIKVEYDIIDDLTVKINYSQDLSSGINGSYLSKFDLVQGNGGDGIAFRETFDNKTEVFEATANYSTKITDGLDLTALLGVATQVRRNEDFRVRVRNFLFDDQGFDNLGFGGVRLGQNTEIASGASKDELNSVFARVNLNYDNTYFLSAAVRRESYSGFGANNKAGNFPAVSAGVQLTELVDMGPVNSLKLRGSYGVTGNLPPNAQLALALFGPGGFVDLDRNPLTPGDVYVNPEQQQNPNPLLKWETKTEINVGLDYVVNNKLSGSIEYYRRDISDLLFNVGVPIGAANPFSPGSVNTVGNTWANIADLTAGGFEFVGSYADVKLGPVSWTPTLNFTVYDKTTIENFSVEGLGFAEIRLATPGSPGQNNNEIIRNSVGNTLGDMYGPEFQGIDEQGRYVLSSDDPADWGIIGNGLPEGEFGFANSFSYGNFDLNVFFRGVWGHDLYNSYRGFYENNDASSRDWNSVVTDKSDSRITDTPTFSSLYVEDASFIRLDNAQIGYNLQMDSKVFSKVRFYVAGQNLFTITDYTGIDPEVRYTDSEDTDGFTASLAPGIERRNTYFTTRSYTVGVNVSFK
ncbi:MAG: TonB-dependent receptor [Cyclobacteriaceae bacterium]